MRVHVQGLLNAGENRGEALMPVHAMEGRIASHGRAEIGFRGFVGELTEPSTFLTPPVLWPALLDPQKPSWSPCFQIQVKAEPVAVRLEVMREARPAYP